MWRRIFQEVGTDYKGLDTVTSWSVTGGAGSQCGWSGPKEERMLDDEQEEKGRDQMQGL